MVNMVWFQSNVLYWYIIWRRLSLIFFVIYTHVSETQELRIIERDCRPDEVFELDCNMCRCNPDGKSFSCTRRACIEPVDEEFKVLYIHFNAFCDRLFQETELLIAQVVLGHAIILVCFT